MNYYIFLNSSSFEYIIVNYFIISLAILKDQPDFVHISHVVDSHMSGLSVTEGRRPELIASNGAFHINKTHPYILMLSPRCFFPLNFLCSDTLWVVLFAHLHCNDNFWKFYWHDLFNDSKFKIRGIKMILYLSYICLKKLDSVRYLRSFL